MFFFSSNIFLLKDEVSFVLHILYRKSSITPPPPRGRAHLISDLPEGGLNREGGLFTKSSDKDIFGSFSVLLPHILRNQHTILRLKYINSTQSLSQTILKLTCKAVQLNKLVIFGKF